ncbi:MAG: phage tail tape measure protein [Bacilli bacterium]|nr:phage tail tape measure protein [Bacilli bacterium]MBO7536100.1 phage tail tape measure protein [Bacilli bacterium]
MFARLQGLSLGETLEDGVDLNKYSSALKTVGVDILDAKGNLKDMDSILDATAEKWNTISEAQKVALAETVAGVRQYSQFMAIMENYDKILVNQDLAAGSSGTLQEQADIYAQSWEAA